MSLITRLRLVPLVLLVLALLPRLVSPGAFVTWDEPVWTYRSIRFLHALRTGDLAGTLLVGHPGVLTMICGAVGIAIRAAALRGAGGDDLAWLAALPSLEPADSLALQRLGPWVASAQFGLALLNGICVVAIYALARRLMGERAALLAGVLVAFDPFHIALSRVLHIDAAASNLMLLSFLALLLFFRSDSRKWILLSGEFAGLAMLTKSYALFLAPLTMLMLGLWLGFRRSSVRQAGSSLFGWGLAASGTFFACWPAMWVAPRTTMAEVLGTAFGYAGEPYTTSDYFLGRVVENPGPLFYPVAIALRTTPLIWLGLLLLAVACVRGSRRDGVICALAREQRGVAAALLLFAVLFALPMTVAAKKYDRYMLPVILSFDLLTAAGLASWIEGTKVRKAIIMIAFAAQIAFVLSFHPYYLAYYNPLVGGTTVARSILPVGWGEGMEQVAAYLNEKVDGRDLIVASNGNPGLATRFKGSAVELTERGAAISDYVVLYVSDMQQGSPLVQPWLEREPEKTFDVAGMEYARVIANDFSATLAAYLEGELGTNDVVVLDSASPLARYPLPVHVLSPEHPEQLEQELGEVTRGRSRLWYVAYPGGDATGSLHYELDAHAVLEEERTFGGTAVLCYRLDPTSHLGLPPTWQASGARFDDVLGLDRFALEEPDLLPGRGLGIALDWQALRDPDRNYALSLRLVDSSGRLWAKEDRWLVDALGLSTAAWTAGHKATTRHLLAVQSDIGSGPYELQLVVYDVETVQQLSAQRPGEGLVPHLTFGPISAATGLPEPLS